VSEQDSNWKYADQIVNEAEPIARARRHALEMGIEPISPAVGAQSALIAAATNAQNIVEIGTGTGVSGLWLLSASPRAVLTSIEAETELQSVARQSFTDAGIAPNRVRLITGRALDVLPRMNENSYDIVFVDGDPAQVFENVEHGLRLVRPGGTVLVPRALWRGRVSDPAQRDEVTTSFRTLVQEIAASDAVVAALSPVGDGLLQLTTRY
jgi:predicted O-methyltransferase YrrM